MFSHNALGSVSALLLWERCRQASLDTPCEPPPTCLASTCEPSPSPHLLAGWLSVHPSSCGCARFALLLSSSSFHHLPLTPAFVLCLYAPLPFFSSSVTVNLRLCERTISACQGLFYYVGFDILPDQLGTEFHSACLSLKVTLYGLTVRLLVYTPTKRMGMPVPACLQCCLSGSWSRIDAKP